MPVKVFGPFTPLLLEQKVNQWIDEVSPIITQMSQSEFFQGNVVMTILYETTGAKFLTESTGPR